MSVLPGRAGGIRGDMSAAAWLVVVLGGALALAAVVWFLTARKTPQTQPGRVVAERPAGPGAESQRVDERGTLLDGPVRPGETPADEP
jgi:hypothetical protein